MKIQAIAVKSERPQIDKNSSAESRRAGQRADLVVTSSLPGIGKGRYWHRIVHFAFKPRFKTFNAHKGLDVHHADDKWWFVRRGGLRWKTPAENRRLQGKAGLAGKAGDRDRPRPPPWAAPR